MNVQIGVRSEDATTVDTSKRRVTRLPLPYRSITRAETEIAYPESDGEPMAETDVHRDLMTDSLLHPLKEYFRHRDDVYVSGNLFLY